MIIKRTKLKDVLEKTGRNLRSYLPFSQKYSKIDCQLLQKIEEALISTDIGVELTEILIDAIKRLEISGEESIREILYRELKKLIKRDEGDEHPEPKPYVILIVGVNGTGKTTTIGKLAYRYSSEGKKVLTVAGDTFRAAAYEQLKIWAGRAGVKFLGNPYGKEPSAVVYDALKSAIAHDIDVVIIDTAGRIHTKYNLMAELEKMKRVANNVIQGAPHNTWLIIDATTGQNGLIQAEEFMKRVGITGIILTKLDGTAKGGIVISINHKINIPIKYLGIGEGVGDLVEFDANKFVDALLGAGV